jgi:hypothetical protein
MGGGGDGWASAAATLRQAGRCRATKDTLTSKEGQWEQEPQFIFRVSSGSGIACGAIDYISMLSVHKIRLICPTAGKSTEKLSEQIYKAADRDEPQGI